MTFFNTFYPYLLTLHTHEFYFFAIHHCKNSHLSLQIFVHHCTFSIITAHFRITAHFVHHCTFSYYCTISFITAQFYSSLHILRITADFRSSLHILCITADFRSSPHILCITAHFSSLHIFVHHCTFCTSLHVKTSPGGFDLPSHCAQRHRRSLSFITSAAQQRHRSLFIWTLEGGNNGCSCILVTIG